MDILPDRRLDPSDVEFIKELIHKKFRFLSRFYDAAHAKMKLLPKDKNDYAPEDVETVKDGYKKAFAQQRSLPNLYWKVLAVLLSITPDDLPSRAAALKAAATKSESKTTPGPRHKKVQTKPIRGLKESKTNTTGAKPINTTATSKKSSELGGSHAPPYKLGILTEPVKRTMIVLLDKSGQTADHKFFVWSFYLRPCPIEYYLHDLDGSLHAYNKAVRITHFQCPTWSICSNIRIKSPLDREIVKNTKAIALHPMNPTAYNNRGVTKLLKGWSNESVEDFNEAIRLNPKSAAAYNNRGVIHANRSEWDNAHADFNTTIELSPRDAFVYINRSHVKRQANDYVGGLTDLNMAIKLQPNNFELYLRRGSFTHFEDTDGAIADYHKAIKLNPQSAAPYYYLGDIKAFKGNLDDAFVNYTKAIALSLKYGEGYNRRGTVAARMNHWHDALSDYDKAIELNPNDFTAYYNRGVVRDWLNLCDEANADYVQALKIVDSVYCGDLLLRGSLNGRIGNLDDALKDFDKLIQFGGGLDKALAYLKRGLVKLLKNNCDEALADVNKAIKLNPIWSAAYFGRGLMNYVKKDYDESLSDLNKAIRLRPLYKNALLFRCFVKYAIGTKLLKHNNKKKASADFLKSALDDKALADDIHAGIRDTPEDFLHWTMTAILKV